MNLSGWFNLANINNGYKTDEKGNYIFDKQGNKIKDTVQPKFDFLIDWGDGSPVEHYDKNSPTVTWGRNWLLDGNQCQTIQVKHTFAKRGVYRVTIQGQCDNLFGHYHKAGNKPDKPAETLSLRKTLYGVLVPKNRVSPLKYAYASFFGCESLNFVGKGVFDGLSECKTLAHLFDGSNLEYVYPNIFSGCPNVQSFAYTFEACPFKFLYSNIFKWTIKADDFQHCFHRCIVFKQIPQKLFDYVPLASNFNNCFRSCTSVTKVPPNLFDNCYYISDMTQCFCGGKDKVVTSDAAYNPIMFINHIPQVWNKPNLRGANFTRYAHGCIHANNYNSYVTWTKLNGYDT